MIYYMIKNARYKYGLVVIVLIITFLTLLKVEKVEGTDALRVVFGGVVLYNHFLLLAFIIMVGLLQYIHADSMILLLKRDMYLITRGKKPQDLLKKLMVTVLISNIILIIVTIASFELSMILVQDSFAELDHLEIIGVSGRGFLTCSWFSLLQMIVLMKCDEMHSFLIMFGISVVFGFLSYLPLGVFSLLPVELAGGRLALNIAICILYIVGTGIVLFILYRRREVRGYDY